MEDHAAVDDDGLAGPVVRVRASEEADDLGDILGFGEAPQGNVLGELLPAPLGRLARVFCELLDQSSHERSLDDTRRNSGGGTRGCIGSADGAYGMLGFVAVRVTYAQLKVLFRIPQRRSKGASMMKECLLSRARHGSPRPPLPHSLPSRRSPRPRRPLKKLHRCRQRPRQASPRSSTPMRARPCLSISMLAIGSFILTVPPRSSSSAAWIRHPAARGTAGALPA